MRFEFATAHQLIFGRGTIQESGQIARTFGSKALVVSGRNRSRFVPLEDSLRKASVAIAFFSTRGEPTIEQVREGVAFARAAKCDFVIGFGGGSAMDCGKAIAGMLANEGDVLDYIEVIGRARPLPNPGVPFIAIPTTAGTGAEVTRNAVLGSKAQQAKASLRSPSLLARVALVDPELSVGLPQGVTASTGLDAVTQLIEAFVSPRANPMTDAFCREGLAKAARSLRWAWETPENMDAREDMCLASLFSGLALASAGLGAVHGFAAPIGGATDAPHGTICASLLPHVMEVNIKALRRAGPGMETSLARYDEIARILTGSFSAKGADAITWVRNLSRLFGVPRLEALGVQTKDIAGLIDKAIASSSMQGNPIKLERAELKEIMDRAA